MDGRPVSRTMTIHDQPDKKSNVFRKHVFENVLLILLVSCLGLFLMAMGPQQVSDRDGDGIPDSSEASWGTNPDMADTDLDGLMDGFEVNGFTLLRIPNRVFTDPLDPDSDDDGLIDGAEVRLQTIIVNGESLGVQSNPMRFDSDGDGISDREEILILFSDPGRADTDGDGLSDSEERSGNELE